MTAQFRIGGVYRNGHRNPIRLTREEGGMLKGEFADKSYEFAFDFDPVTGAYTLWPGNVSIEPALHLLPGELTLKDGEWGPVEDGQQIAGPDATVEQVMDAIADMHISEAANAAMIARDDTEGARLYAQYREQVRQVAQMLAGSLPSTAHPALPALQRIASEGDPLFGSAYLKR